MTKKKTKKKHKHPRLHFVLRVSLLTFLVILLILFALFYKKYGKMMFAMQAEANRLIDISTVDTFSSMENSMVYDSNSKLISILKGEKDSYYMDIKEIPQFVQDVMVVSEDRRYYSHNGVDVKGSLRAFWELVKNRRITQGGSTITQQLCRNIYLTSEVKVERKVKEIFLAWAIEKKYSKQQILEFYLNNIYFANGYYGIEGASKGYFSCSVKELSMAQMAFLCAIPNSPTRYNPEVNFEQTVERKNRLLKQMLEQKKITQAEYDNAYNETITLNISTIKKQNYVQTYVNYCATRVLMEKQGFVFQYDFASDSERQVYKDSYSRVYEECQKQLFSGGYQIYTSIDMSRQKELQKVVNEALKEDKSKGEDGTYEFQGAAVCIENRTGRVIAIVGGRSQKTEGYTLNRAYQSYRQPGSAIKPLLVYTPAFEEDYTPNKYMKDAPIKDGPKNSDGRYSGYISIRRAVEQSKNTVAWNLFEELTAKKCMKYLLKMKFGRISKKDYYPAAAIGGFTNGVSPVEMTAAYAALENDGIYRDVTCIVKMEDSDGNTITGSKPKETRVYTEEASRTMTDVMTGVMKYGTGRGLALDNMSCAGKTGTTNDKKDGWFVGYTPYYTMGVWVGYDMPKTMDDLHGNTYPGAIWKNYMTILHEGLTSVEFPKNELPQTNFKNPMISKTPAPSVKPSEDTDDETSEDDTEPLPSDSDIGEGGAIGDSPVVPPDNGEASTVPEPPVDSTQSTVPETSALPADNPAAGTQPTESFQEDGTTFQEDPAFQ